MNSDMETKQNLVGENKFFASISTRYTWAFIALWLLLPVFFIRMVVPESNFLVWFFIMIFIVNLFFFMHSFVKEIGLTPQQLWFNYPYRFWGSKKVVVPLAKLRNVEVLYQAGNQGMLYGISLTWRNGYIKVVQLPRFTKQEFRDLSAALKAEGIEVYESFNTDRRWVEVRRTSPGR
jgi:hypothetical protein